MNWYMRLHQARVWIDAADTEHAITGMSPGHSQAVLRWIHRNAAAIVGQAATDLHGTPLPSSATAYDSVAPAIEREHTVMAHEPAAWLLDTPLVHALRVHAGWDTCPNPHHPKDCRD